MPPSDSGVDPGGQAVCVLMGYEVAVADDQALALLLEVAETEAQLRGEAARSTQRIMMTGYGADHLGRALIAAAEAVQDPDPDLDD